MMGENNAGRVVKNQYELSCIYENPSALFAQTTSSTHHTNKTLPLH